MITLATLHNAFTDYQRAKTLHQALGPSPGTEANLVSAKAAWEVAWDRYWTSLTPAQQTRLAALTLRDGQLLFSAALDVAEMEVPLAG